MMEDVKDFIESEMRSCSMDYGCITPERAWGGSVAIEEIANAMVALRRFRNL